MRWVCGAVLLLLPPPPLLCRRPCCRSAGSPPHHPPFAHVRAPQEASQATADNRGLLEAADAAADPEGAYRLGWLAEQLPAVERRLGGVDGQAAPARAAANALLGLRRQVLEVYSQSLAQPPLEDVQAQRDAALADMLAGLGQAGLAVAAGAGAGPADVRGAVADAIRAAKQLPEMPRMPVDYSGLLASIARWVEELRGAAADVAAARQAAGAAVADAAQQLASADRGADPQAWHRLAWLRCVPGVRWEVWRRCW